MTIIKVALIEDSMKENKFKADKVDFRDLENWRQKFF